MINLSSGLKPEDLNILSWCLQDQRIPKPSKNWKSISYYILGYCDINPLWNKSELFETKEVKQTSGKS